MKKSLFLFFAILFFALKIFAAQDCFVVTDLASGKIIKEQGNGCNKQISPCATFKIALSLMGFDANILRNTKRPIWQYQTIYGKKLRLWKNYKRSYYGGGWSKWKRSHNPSAWIKNSCLWYSQILTKKLGMEKFQNYVDLFDYGNKDLTGNLKKKDGFTYAWSNSSLKISPLEQVAFLRRMLQKKLNVSEHAYDMTKDLLFITVFTNGWQMYGKTGNCFQKDNNGKADVKRQIGWFVGWVTKGSHTYVFARNIMVNTRTTTEAGFIAEGQASVLLLKSGLLNN